MADVCGNYGPGGILKAFNVNIYGNGSETMVLAHGYGEDQGVWHFMVPLLACYFKLVVFDVVFSPKVSPQLFNTSRYRRDYVGYVDDLLCLLDHLQIEKTLYLGHSASAMVGCLASIKRPHLFTRIILLSGSPRYLNDTGYTGGFTMQEVNTIYLNISSNFSGWVQVFAPHAVEVNNTAAIAKFEKSLEGMKRDKALKAAKTVFPSDLRKDLPNVTVPCIIIQSKMDPIVPESVAYYIKNNLGGYAEVRILPTKGHFPHLTAHHLLFNALNETHQF